MPEHPEATSPTGTPVVSPTSVPLYLVVGVALAAGFTAAGQMLPETYALARVICTVLGVAIGAGLGVAWGTRTRTDRCSSAGAEVGRRETSG